MLALLLLSLVSSSAAGQESVWAEMNPATAPSPRIYHDLAYDSEFDRIVLFGGSIHFGGQMGDTWTYDLNTDAWTNMEPSSSPAPRSFHAMAYDAESGRVILFGGLIHDGPETWSYDLFANVWTNMNPPVQPTAWGVVRMVYDGESDHLVLFGGCAGRSLEPTCAADIRGETWAYDFNTNTWTNMEPDPSPSVRVFHGMAYDSESDRTILFGGATSPADSHGDTWAYDLNTNSWEEMSPRDHPSRRNSHSMAYDAGSDRVVLFGGCCNPNRNDTWAYDYNSDTWTQTDLGLGPSERQGAAAAYDRESDRLVLFGGDVASGFPFVPDQETWIHRLAPVRGAPDALLVSLQVAVGAAAVVGAVAIVLVLRRRGKRRGEG